MEETLEGVVELYMLEATPTVLTLLGETGVLPGSSFTTEKSSGGLAVISQCIAHTAFLSSPSVASRRLALEHFATDYFLPLAFIAFIAL
jgi:hypothetical protein